MQVEEEDNKQEEEEEEEDSEIHLSLCGHLLKGE